MITSHLKFQKPSEIILETKNSNKKTSLKLFIYIMNAIKALI